MPDVLIYAGTIDPAMRHEVPIGIPDPFLYVERGGERHVVLTSFEIDRVNAILAGRRRTRTRSSASTSCSGRG